LRFHGDHFNNLGVTPRFKESGNFGWIIHSVPMRFVALYNHDQVPHTQGFKSLADALDFLFWGYEHQQVLPYGIYDRITDQITLYTHRGQLIHAIEEESLRKTVRRHLSMTHRPITSRLC
jgi:hypothetical protein